MSIMPWGECGAEADPSSQMSLTALSVQGLTVLRGGRKILDGIGFSLEAGTITAIVGCSGVGKTTLLHCLNGLITPDAGRIEVEGRGCLSDPEVLQAHRRRSATVYQDHALIGRMTALDNVLLGLADRRHPLSPLPWPKEMKQQAAQVLDDVGLLDRAGTRVRNLSGGERQRVGLARALVRRPRLLLGDEPFASADPVLTRAFSDDIRRAVDRSGLTVLLVLHQLEVAMRLADRIIGLADGQLVYNGSAEHFTADARRRVFLGLEGEPA